MLEPEVIQDTNAWDDFFFVLHTFDSNTISQACSSLVLNSAAVHLKDLVIIGESGTFSTKQFKSSTYASVSSIEPGSIEKELPSKKNLSVIVDLHSNVIHKKLSRRLDSPLVEFTKKLVPLIRHNHMYFTVLPLNMTRITTLLHTFSSSSFDIRLVITTQRPSTFHERPDHFFELSSTDQPLPSPLCAFCAIPRLTESAAPQTITIVVADNNGLHYQRKFLFPMPPSLPTSPPPYTASSLLPIIDLLKFFAFSCFAPNSLFSSPPSFDSSALLVSPRIPIFTAIPHTIVLEAVPASPLPRLSYSIQLLDVHPAVFEGGPTPSPCAVFVVPQGRQDEWLFGTEAGQLSLISGSPALRAIFLSFGEPSQRPFALIQNDVTPFVKKVLPAAAVSSNATTPFVTLAQNPIGLREPIREGWTEKNGLYRVEDVVVEVPDEEKGVATETHRRLVFFHSPHVIQSECRVLRMKQDGEELVYFDHLRPSSHVDRAIVSSFAFLFATSLSPLLVCAPTRPLRCAVLGRGMGVLALFLRSLLSSTEPSAPSLFIDAVDNDSSLEPLARDCFGFLRPTDGLKVTTAEADVFLNETARNSDRKEGKAFDVVIVNLNGRTENKLNYSPPLALRTSSFFVDLKASLSPSGVAIIRCCSPPNTPSLPSLLAPQFHTIVSVPVVDTGYDVLVCFSQEPSTITIDTIQSCCDKFLKHITDVQTLNKFKHVNAEHHQWILQSLALSDVLDLSQHKTAKSKQH
ncbi:putative Methyltransferase type 11 [Blattamonas nauphoetae]|uniref:Methyltransferase type 11 n=1 Tax=Blattamonas nauphoetae TaxID=2049346 RepID=A0ABQ9XYZ3_9EUKA|nr:putative Methyltransferase type 11 [Blattamonas nauphoetae]